MEHCGFEPAIHLGHLADFVLLQAIQKGNLEGAKIHAENAIRQKNQALNYRRMSARIDAVSARVQTALTTQKVKKQKTFAIG